MSHTNATASDVQDLLDTSLTLSEIQPYLAAAKRFVTDNLEGQGVEDATLTEIEKHLAAGIVASERDPTAASESVGDVQVTYQRDHEDNEHFRIATMLDPTGTIASAMNREKAARWRTGTSVE